MTIGPWSLPPDWNWRAFEEVARVASDLVDPGDYQEAPHVAPNHIESQTGRLLPTQTVEQDGVTSAKHRFREGQVLYSKIRPYLAKVTVAPFAGLCSADMYPIDTDMDPRFLKWWMLTPAFTQLAAGQQARTVLPKINKQALNALPVPVPPLEEQRRITAALESHISHLESAERIIGSAERRTDTLLASSLSRLWQRAVDASGTTPIQEVGSVATGSTPPARIENAFGGGTPFITPADVGRGDHVSSSQRSLTSAGASSVRLVGPSAVLAVCIGATIGKIGWIDQVSATNQQINSISLDPATVNARYLTAVMTSPQFQDQMLREASNTTMPLLNKTNFAKLQVPLPPGEVQKQLMRELDASRDVVLHARATFPTVKTKSTALRQCLLAAAFSGRLSGRTADASKKELALV